MQTLILCKSLTNAQKGAFLLERRGITAVVVKAPLHLRNNGCGYALSLSRRAREAVEILKGNRLTLGRIYQREGNGDYREVSEYDLS